MKLTLLLLTAAIVNVSASGISQTISFNGKNASLQEVFTTIKKQTGFAVVCNTDLLDKANTVTLNVTNLPLQDFLQQVFKDQPLIYVIKNTSIFISSKVTESTIPFSEQQLLEISGRVTDENGEPLVGANIIVNGTNLSGTTDSKGYYKIENILPGEYKVEVSFVGYATKSITIKVIERNSTPINFILTHSLVNLDEMTITSTLSKRLIRAYPATIAEIKGKDLENRNLTNIANVIDAIPGIIIPPGSEIANSGNTREPSGIFIRGVNAGPIKYLVDGIEIVATGGAQTIGASIFETLDPNNIEKIEVLKGPMASTLYGNGAAGGIISITTKKGKTSKTRLNFKTMFTQYANDYADKNGYSQDYSLNASGGNEQVNYLIGYNYNLYPLTKLTDINNGIDQKTNSFIAKMGMKIKNIAGDISLQYGKQKKGYGNTQISENKYRESLGLDPLPLYGSDSSEGSQRNFLTSLHLTHTITDNWYQDLTIGYNITNSRVYTTGSPVNTPTYYEYLYSKMNVRYFMFYSHLWSKSIKSNITAGFEHIDYETLFSLLDLLTPLTNFHNNSVASDGLDFVNLSPYSSTGYFAEVVTEFKNKLFLTTGIRFDKNPAYGDNVGAYAQPRVGLTYVIESDKFKIKPRIAWGVSSNAPDPQYKSTSIQTSPFFTLVINGNPDIKPERSEGYEFGADIFYKSNYSLNVTYYNQKIKDRISSISTYDFNANPILLNYYYYNLGEVINKGIEISAKVVIDPFIIDLSYTGTTSEWGSVTGQEQTSTIYPHAPSLGIPKNSIFARLSYKIPSFFHWTKQGGRVSLEWRHNGDVYNYDGIGYSLDVQKWESLPDPKPATPNIDDYYLLTKGYSFFNLRADYSVYNNTALYIDIQNLLDKQGSINGQSLARFPGRRINFGFNISL